MSAIDQAIAKMRSEMQAAGASQNPHYLAMLAAQDAAKTTGGNLDDLMDEANTKLGLPVAPRAKAAAETAPPVSSLPVESEITDTGGGSGGKGDSHGSAESGPLGSGTEGTYGDISTAMSALSNLGAVPGLAAASTLGPIGTVLGMVPMASSISRALGGQYDYDPMLTAPDQMDLQGMMDSLGYGSVKESEARSAISAARAEAQQMDNDYTGYGPQPGGARDFGGPAPGGWGGARSAPDSPVGVADNPSDPNAGGVSVGVRGAQDPGTPGFGFGGWGDNPDPGGGGAPGGDPSGGGQTGGGLAGGGEAKGGVRRTIPGKPRWAIYGEKEPETAVFVPDSMRKGGKQPNEDAVIMALESLLAELKGKR